MRKAKRIAVSALAAAISLSAVSCKTETIHKSIEVPTRISFSWWGSDIRADYTIAAIANYEKEHANIDVMPYSSDFTGYKENLDVLFANGKESDVLQINYAWLYDYSPDGDGFYDLYELSDYINLNNFSEEELEYGTVDGKLNAIPISLNAVTFFYNSELLEKYGLDVPSTWNDLFACASVLSEDGVYVLDTSDIFRWLMLTAHEEQVSGKAVFLSDDSVGFDAENVISMMEFYRELIDSKVMPYGTTYEKNNFFTGKTAGQVRWISDAQTYVTPLEAEYFGSVAIGDYLTTESYTRSGWYLKPTSLYAISRSTKNPQKAAEFLNYMLNDENVAELQGVEKGVPLSRSALETLGANNMLFGTSYEAGKQITETEVQLSKMPQNLEDSESYNNFFTQFDLYYYGQKTVEEAAEDFISEWTF